MLDTVGLTKKKSSLGVLYYESRNGDMVAKKCTSCLEVKGLYEFSVCRKSLGRRQAKCKDCNRAYREKNKDYIRKQGKLYREKNKDLLRERDRLYRENNKECIKNYQDSYRDANRERLKEAKRKYREENIEKERERGRRYYREHIEDIKKYKINYRKVNKGKIRRRLRKYYRENRQKLKSYQKYYYQANKEYVRKRKAEYFRKQYADNPEPYIIKNHNKRAKKRSLPNTLSVEEWEKTYDHFAGCALSGTAGGLHKDHIIPIEVGYGGTIFENMIPLRSDLNESKSDYNLFDWFYGLSYDGGAKERYKLAQRKFDELVRYLADINGMTVDEYEQYVRWCDEKDACRRIDEKKDKRSETVA